MRNFLLDILVCPSCKSRLELEGAVYSGGEIESGALICACNKSYPVRNGIPRFIDSDSYAGNFSFEWNYFAQTQLDSFNGTEISARRFKEITGFEPWQLKDKIILEAGCGMGRFLEVAAKYGREVIGVDLSFSIDAARRNLKNFSNVHLVQADIFNMPFKRHSFDLIYSIGVLHHTPEPRKAFLQFPCLLSEGGTISIWVTPKRRFSWFPRATQIVRLFTPRMDSYKLLRLIQKAAPFYLPLVRMPFIGNLLKGWVIPVCDYKGQLPLNDSQLLQWSILDTFDLLSPRYLYAYTLLEVKNWFTEQGFSDIVMTLPPVTVRARKTKNEALCAD